MPVMPGLIMIPPCDANETAVAQKVAMKTPDRTGGVGANPTGAAHVRPQTLCVGGRPLFEVLPQAGRDAVLPPFVGARLAVELGLRQGGERYIGAHGDMLDIERFGASAPADVLLREYGFTVDNACKYAEALLARHALH